jgi:broad specificity phosphatase PhoE/predicted kinase
MNKLCIIMVGLPARGKSTIALRLFESLSDEGIRTRIFNNGELRRQFLGESSSQASFYSPDNAEARAKREVLARLNAERAITFLRDGGQVAILDATNAGRPRRAFLRELLADYPILFVECVNNSKSLLEASVQRKSKMPEFAGLSPEEAVAGFMERIGYYERIYSPLRGEGSFIRVDTLRNEILAEELPYKVPYYIPIREVLVTDWVRDLYLARHGQSVFNTENRIGGDAGLTTLGQEQAGQLVAFFHNANIPYIFTSQRLRSRQTAEPLSKAHPEATVIALSELDEINAGICDSMRYEDIRSKMPDEYSARAHDKYNYVYPQGESYAMMRPRVELGLRKAMFLSGGQPGIVLIGHQAVNRMILSLFLYRREVDVPYIYVPQDQCFHIVMTQSIKLFERKHLGG